MPKLRLILATILFAALAPLATATPVAASSAVDGSSCKQWIRGVDISAYQPNIVWTEVQDAGIGFVYIKATEGTWYTNGLAGSQRAGAASVGLPYGNYDFARPSDNATQDAQYFVNNGGATGSLPPVLDLEVSDGQPTWAVVNWANTWLATVHALTGRTPTLYTGAGYGWAWDGSLTAYPLWVAAYPWGYTAPPGSSACGLGTPGTAAWGAWSIWQYTSVGNVWGIPGNVDVDAASPAWFTAATGAGVAPPNSPGTDNRYPAATWGPGSFGGPVRHIQNVVNFWDHAGLVADGQYGPATTAAVIHFQSELHVTADGIWGPATTNAYHNFAAYMKALAAQQAAIAAALKFIAACMQTTLGPTSHGACVHLAKNLLIRHHFGVLSNGKWYPHTTKMVIAFQASRHIPQTGLVDRKTWHQLAK